MCVDCASMNKLPSCVNHRRGRTEKDWDRLLWTTGWATVCADACVHRGCTSYHNGCAGAVCMGVDMSLKCDGWYS